MSLLGRLEDLSLTDIIQIVFLSRRTGVLEIIDDRGRHTVLFRHGLVVNASAPDHPDLASWLAANEAIPAMSVKTLHQMEESGIPCGTAAVEMNLMSPDDLAAAVRNRIQSVVTPLLQSREGEFNFILSDNISALDIEYDADALFREGGLAPNRILGGEGERVKPLKGLEESLKAGKALLRGTAPAEVTPASLNLGLGERIEKPSDNVVRFPAREEPREEAEFTPIEEPEPAPPPAPEPPPVAEPPAARPPTGQFKVAGGLIEVQSPEAAYRNVVLFERNPLIRVAARRAFTRKDVKIAQFGTLDDVRTAISDLVRANSFFVTFLELTDDDASVQILQRLKKRNPRLPVVVVDAEPDLRRRHSLLRAGADLYLTKPSPARLLPGLAEEELALFADELVLFAERSFAQWEEMTGGFDADAGRRFYDLAQKESLDRSFSILKQLINELSNPNDIGQVSSTILRLSAEYLERGALFMVGDAAFTGLGGFGITGGGDDMASRVRTMRFARSAPSVLAEVVQSGEAHRGKMKKTATNVELVEKMGGILPTEVAAFPILHAGRTIGILYGDNAEHRVPIDNTTGLEIFLSQAGYAFGNAVFASEQARSR